MCVYIYRKFIEPIHNSALFKSKILIEKEKKGKKKQFRQSEEQKGQNC